MNTAEENAEARWFPRNRRYTAEQARHRDLVPLTFTGNPRGTAHASRIVARVAGWGNFHAGKMTITSFREEVRVCSLIH